VSHGVNNVFAKWHEAGIEAGQYYRAWYIMIQYYHVFTPFITKQSDDSLFSLIGRGETDCKGIIDIGENSNIEFKSTLRVDIKTNKPEKYIEISAMKTIAAFLNTNGGVLFIGVNDDKNILGLTHDFDSFNKS